MKNNNLKELKEKIEKRRKMIKYRIKQSQGFIKFHHEQIDKLEKEFKELKIAEEDLK